MADTAHNDHWKSEPESHDFAAAAAYLSLLFSEATVASVVESLRVGEIVEHAAKDLLRASRLALLPSNEREVRKDINKVKSGRQLSPVLLLRGRGGKGIPLVVADGYHRICASYHLDEDAAVPARIVALP